MEDFIKIDFNTLESIITYLDLLLDSYNNASENYIKSGNEIEYFSSLRKSFNLVSMISYLQFLKERNEKNV